MPCNVFYLDASKEVTLPDSGVGRAMSIETVAPNQEAFTFTEDALWMDEYVSRPGEMPTTHIAMRIYIDSTPNDTTPAFMTWRGHDTLSRIAVYYNRADGDLYSFLRSPTVTNNFSIVNQDILGTGPQVAIYSIDGANNQTRLGLLQPDDTVTWGAWTPAPADFLFPHGPLHVGTDAPFTFDSPQTEDASIMGVQAASFCTTETEVIASAVDLRDDALQTPVELTSYTDLTLPIYYDPPTGAGLCNVHWVGDSVIAGSAASAADNRLVNIASNILDLSFTNTAVGNSGIINVGNDGRTIYQRWIDDTRDDPTVELVLVHASGNDRFHPTADVTAEWTNFFNDLDANGVPWIAVGMVSANQRLTYDVREINRQFIEAATNGGYANLQAVVDPFAEYWVEGFTTTIADNGFGMFPEFFVDSVHPNDDGMAYLAQRYVESVGPTIEALVAAKQLPIEPISLELCCAPCDTPTGGLTTGEVEDIVAAAIANIETGLTKTEVRSCVDQAIIDAGIISAGTSEALSCCDAQVLRIDQCGQSFLLGDHNGDRVIEADFSPVVVNYSGVAPNPSSAVTIPGSTPDGVPDGIVPFLKVARRASDGCITHIAICDEWICVAGTEIVAPPSFETICIDTPATPTVLNTDTAGLTVGGVFYPFNITCPDATTTSCPGQVIVYDGPNNPNGTPLPDLAFQTITSNTPLPDPQGCDYIVVGDNNTQQRETYRFEFPLWSTNGGTILSQDATTIELEFEVLARSDNIGVGLLSPNVPQWANVASVTPPAGAINTFHYVNFGDHVTLATGASPPAFPVQGKWRIVFTTQSSLPPNQAIDAVFWSIGNSGPANEDVRNLRMTVSTASAQPCYQVPNAAALAALANTVEPNDETTWTSQGDQICAVTPDVNASQYQNGQAALTT